MIVQVKYCGGCNPRYDRVEFLQHLMNTFPEIEFRENIRLLCHLVKKLPVAKALVLAAKTVILDECGKEVCVALDIDRIEHGEGIRSKVQQGKTLDGAGVSTFRIALKHVKLDKVPILVKSAPCIETLQIGVPAVRIRVIEHSKEFALAQRTRIDKRIVREKRPPQVIILMRLPKILISS